MIKIPNVAPSELREILSSLKAGGQATVAADTDSKGTITAKVKIGFVPLHIEAEYFLTENGQLCISANHAEDQIKEHLEKALDSIRGTAAA